MARILQIKISLKHIEPLIYRTIHVQDDTNFHDLHLMIQAAFGWTYSHVYIFKIRGLNIETRNPYTMDFISPENSTLEAKETKINQFLLKPGNNFSYVYDLGDYFEHEILIEEVVKEDKRVKYPKLVDGARRCAPEDMGGPHFYSDFVKMLTDGDVDEDFEHILEWLGDEFDPEYFDLKESNKDLRNYKDWDFNEME
ncbi:plasmid pRiA4b ORF-3 family protein [Haloplasma contractile]|uniref:Plasmid pRiA4b ORF-3 family protein n=1 Tax=Haloplasma contractile SSD-17B TaxID=1033810 RepID=F7PWB2_9MOLU|nr:plasmid pRiA4b ORF-3 family protein [Haloplasma contractile]ERJ11231.1 plasmid pRiA4b ORF-3 family protein [Haloplasma contractile SSD-17B]